MSIDTITTVRLGYGGRASINGIDLLVSSGDMSNSVSSSYTSAYLMPNDETSRSRILHADGTVTHSGNLSFDLTLNSLGILKTILHRNSKFNVVLCDGEFGQSMTQCVASSITISGTPSSLMTGSVAFSSHLPPVKITNSNLTNRRDEGTAGIIPYWWSGNSYVRDWTFNFNQQVTAKFANKNEYLLIDEGILASSPLYLFVGEIDCSLDFTTFCPLVTDKVYIANDIFRIQGRTTGTAYNIGGKADLGSYKYSIQSHALGSNDNPMLTIT